MFLDETGFESRTERQYAWAMPGKRVFSYVDGNKRKRTSLIGANRDRRLIAPWLFEGTCNAAVFNTWLEKELLPILVPGTVIILDHAAFHKTKSTLDIIAKSKCQLLFLPPYSPPLNPIEKLWANLKRFWRNHANMTLGEMIVSSICLCN